MGPDSDEESPRKRLAEKARFRCRVLPGFHQRRCAERAGRVERAVTELPPWWVSRCEILEFGRHSPTHAALRKVSIEPLERAIHPQPEG